MSNVGHGAEERPLVTLAVFSYNQSEYIEHAVESALRQTYRPLEIIVSDDCSSDETFSIARETVEKFCDQASVRLNRNETNLGVCAHFNKVFDLASGSLVVVAAGDDLSSPDRVEELVRLWKKTGASALYSNARMIDQSGQCVGSWRVADSDSEHAVRLGPGRMTMARFYGAAAAYDRSLIDRFGKIPENVRNEDYNLAFRAFVDKGVACSEKPLVSWRVHGDNLSFMWRLKEAKGMASTFRILADRGRNDYLNRRNVIRDAKGAGLSPLFLAKIRVQAIRSYCRFVVYSIGWRLLKRA